MTMITREDLDREVADAIGKIVPLVVKKHALVWVGSGISQDIPGQNGKPYYPNWNSLIEDLCITCGVERGAITTAEQLLNRADDCKAAKLEDYYKRLGEVFGGQPPTPSRSALVTMDFARDVTITTNYDLSLEEAADHHNLGIIVQAYPHLSPSSEDGKPCLVYLHGRAPNDKGQPATDLVLTATEFEGAYARESVEEMGNAFYYLLGKLPGQSVLFIGYSLREPEVEITLRQLRDVERRFDLPKGDWVMLAPRTRKPRGDGPEAERQANKCRDEEEQIRRVTEYGVEVVGYTSIDNDHSQLERILKELRDSARAALRGESLPSLGEPEGVKPYDT